MIKLIIFILFCMTAVQLQSLHRYEIIFDHLELPKIDDLFDYGTVRIKKFNRTTFAINGYCDLLKPLSDDLEGEFHIYAYHGNEYKKLQEKKVKKLCTFYKEDKMFVPQVLNQTSFINAVKTCPVEPQRLHFYDTTAPGDFLPLEPPKGEKYRLNILYTLNGQVLSNFSVYFSLKKIDDGGLAG